MKLSNHHDNIRTIYYSICIFVFLVGGGTWLWKTILFPQHDFKFSYSAGANVLPTEVQDLNTPKWGPSALDKYISVSVTNITPARFDGMELLVQGEGYAQVKELDGKWSATTPFKDRLALRDLPADGTVVVNAWSSYPSFAERVTVIHSHGKQVVFDKGESSSWWLLGLLVGAAASVLANFIVDIWRYMQKRAFAEAIQLKVKLVDSSKIEKSDMQ